MKDSLNDIIFYRKAQELYDLCWTDTDTLVRDVHGIEISRQMIKSVGSISANIEGYGRGFGKEYPQFLRIARGSARESKEWYKWSKFLLDNKTIEERTSLIDEITAMLVKTIRTLETKRSSSHSSHRPSALALSKDGNC